MAWNAKTLSSKKAKFTKAENAAAKTETASSARTPPTSVTSSCAKISAPKDGKAQSLEEGKQQKLTQMFHQG